ncbi:MAG TPA: sugar phosphate nucleotidyltransferase [Methylomirabilota bacterium]|nr:sugar phosphate nucleotidyltransferase [Methylomirabilota bacterium]
MKIVLFAGGVGSRLWPLSRKNAPKQFGKIIGDKTMLQLAVAKLFPDFAWKDIYISTGKKYEDNVKSQLPELPNLNVLVEPEMRDVGPAVGLVTALFVKRNPDEPIALLWGSDHLVRKEDLFRQALKTAEELIKKDGNRIIFVGQKPRFASQNLGYIEFGSQIATVNELPVYSFNGFKYRPHLSTAEKWYKDGHHSWNLGYFVTTPQFLWKLFEDFAPELYRQLKQISDAVDTPDYERVLAEVYPQIEKISFDNAVLEKMDPKFGYVISVDLEWSDIGAWEALKEALEKHEEDNVIKGNALVEDSRDTLVFNFTKQLVVGIDMNDMVIVNTDDVILVCPKTSVPKIKKLVESLEGTSNGHLV